MKRALWVLGLSIFAFGPIASVNAGKIDDALNAAMENAADDELIPALVFLADRVDLKALKADLDAERATNAERHRRTVVALRQKAAETQTELMEYLLDLSKPTAEAPVIADVHAFWIVNAFGMHATKSVLRDLAERDDVGHLFYQHQMVLDEPVSMGEPEYGDGGYRSDPEPGVAAVRAPECWDMGIDGTGVLTSTLDTGVDGKHKALADRWRGLDDRYTDNPEWAFFDPVTDKKFPFDSGSHGTHTMGTVLGGAPGDSVGVAPGAQFIHAAVIDRVSIQQTVDDAIKAFQWLVDPDGDADTYWDVPTACSNSWRLVTGHGYPPCDDTFWEYLDACESASIIILFSAGNEGPTKESVGRPPDRATTDYMCFSVGAVNANQSNWPIASFSSRGPSHCTEDGSEAIKPEIAAPGENVRSSVPGNGYSNFSGTSMASPHVNGVCTLMRQANPEITVDEAKQIIFDTAVDLGKEGEDNDYGHGMIDAYECVLRAIDLAGVKFEYPNGRPFSVDPDGGTKLRFNVLAGPKDNPVAGTGKILIDNGAGYFEGKIKHLGDNQYEATFGETPCNIIVKYYVTVEGESGKTYVHPAGAPKTYWTTRVYNEVGVAYTDNFESNRGFLTAKDNKTNSGLWERGVPVGDKNWPYAPATDSDGSGSCWLTENQTGNSDIDGGAVYLTTGALDMSLLVNLRYSYWYEEVSDADNSDYFAVQISKTGEKDTWKQVARHETANGRKWLTETLSRATLEATGVKLGTAVYVRFIAADKGGGNIVEAAIDDLQIDGPVCNPHGPKGLRGDMNCDESVDFNDIDPFVAALISQDDYESQYPGCNYMNGDINQDDSVDFNDIDFFVECLINGTCD